MIDPQTSPHSKRIFLIALWLAVSATATAWAMPSQNSASPVKAVTIRNWLVAGPLASPLPAFAESKVHPYGLADLLQFESADIGALEPAKGAPSRLAGAKDAPWREVMAGDKGVELVAPKEFAETAYLAAHLVTTRWLRAHLAIQSPEPFLAYVDGRLVASKLKPDKPEAKPAPQDTQVTADIKLETGGHTLIIKSVDDQTVGFNWLVDAELDVAERLGPDALTLSTTPQDRMSIRRLLDGPKSSAAVVSPDGEFVALSIRQSVPPTDDSEAWVEICRAADGSLVRTVRCPGFNGTLEWAGASKRFTITTYDRSGGTIWLGDLADGSLKPILAKVPGLGGHVWARDGSFCIYEVSDEPDKDIEGVKRLRGLLDRQPGFRSRGSLYRLDWPGGRRQRLTAGDLTTSLDAISPDGKSLLVARTIVDYKVRPYELTELSIVSLETLQAAFVWKGSWLTSAQWSPDGDSLLLLGGPSMFGDVGVKVPKGMTPNDYDIQAYLFSLASRTAVSLTRDFDPSVDEVFWSSTGDENLYVLATDGAGRHAYRANIRTRTFTPLPVGRDVIEQMSVARLKPTAAVVASEPNSPPRAFLVDLETAAVRPLADPGAGDYARVEFGKVERWTFHNKRGTLIEGAVYYPPDFDPARKYPCLVNYYGGTTPITGQFGGRYPKELYAAEGYVVYVLQPSGAIGFGQAFSALHVNDWGMIVADEIIDGVKKFLADHPFVDPHRVGCIGASYGGFMTELLVTRTNLFAAAVSHAGISSISGYWGEGYWGYSYSAVASANSFPWNRPDIYVNQSPLYSADKITTPLLLLHGSADTNVPPGQSAELYTALKLLGREVEFVQILDQDHLILTYGRRIVWMKTILAWFDRWLKGQGEWWNDLYPQK